MKISDIVLDGIGFSGIKKNKYHLFKLDNPTISCEGHRIDISKVYVGNNDIHHSIFELTNWYITKFSERCIIMSDTPTLNASSDTIVITPQDLLSPDYHTKFYDYDYADYADNKHVLSFENYSNLPFSIIRPDQIYVFSDDIDINCEYVIDLVFDNGENMRIFAQVMDKTIDRMECHGLIVANRITGSDTFYSDRITFNLKSSEERIAFISIKRDDLSDPEYPCITDITMYKIKRYCLQVRFDCDLMDVFFPDKED